ncbi:MAG: hypothetical protein E7Z88_08245 [Cyanobacteria bacterium SIG27]|nr:hypothetical protein [Cyanobacteria bacterium SIG27]
MIINSLNSNLAFGRALTTNEKKDFEQITSQARQALRLDKTTATIFDFSVPTKEHDTGIGTSFSADAQELASMLKTMCGVNSIQLGPQGEISNYVRSPYSGTNFSLGSHLIDLTKLKNEEYGKLLTSWEFSDPYFKNVKDSNKVDYGNVFSEYGQDKMLKIAFSRFELLEPTNPLKQEFEQFQKENAYWLERDALFEAAAVANGTPDVSKWSYRDQNVFATPQGDSQRIYELKQVNDEETGLNIVEYNKFVQFIADKQQKESKAKFNQQGIKIYGDSQIGFSQKDFWAHKSAFSKTYEFGCDIGDEKYSCWSPAIDFSKLNGEAGKLLYNKFNLFFKRYDGARIDAAWQYVKPLVCEPQKDRHGNNVFDNNGNKLGNAVKHQPQVPNHGEFIMKNIILKAADDNGIPHNQIFLELLGGNSYDSLDAVKNTGMTLIHISRYANDGWGRVKYYESYAPDSKYQNMRPGDYTFGPGTHDDITAIEQAQNPDRAGLFAKDLRLNEQELKQSPKARLKAMFAEMFTTKNQFATISDIFGSTKRINTPNTTLGNWEYRTGNNYEETYHKALRQGKGLNYADALAKALKAKHGPQHLISKLEHYAHVLEQNGPMTTKEADKLYA